MNRDRIGILWGTYQESQLVTSLGRFLWEVALWGDSMMNWMSPMSIAGSSSGTGREERGEEELSIGSETPGV